LGLFPAGAALPARKTQTISLIAQLNYPVAQASTPLTRFAEKMHAYTLKEKAKIAAGAVTALVIVAWLAVIALALLS
jgi:hypothetical protein